MKTAAELRAEGRRLVDARIPVVFLYPSQEHLAVDEQVPYLRYDGMRYDDEPRRPQANRS